MVRRGLTILIVFMLALAACEAGSSGPTSTAGGSTTSVGESTTRPPNTSTTTPVSTTTTQIDLSGVDLPPEVLAQLEVLVDQAEEVRGLAFLEAPDILVVSAEELEQRIRDDFLEDSADLPADEALYKLLGLLPADADFQSLLLDLYGEQVAGAYDLETGEIVIRAREGELSVVERSTMLHELVHALTDQNFAFYSDYKAMFDEERLDEAAAYQALIEGDATLATVMWLRGLSQRELGEFVAESLGVDSTAIDNAPEFLAETLLFPYEAGLGFTQALYDDGGWESINQAYSLMVGLPGSTEQVITPGDYQRDLPEAVPIPELSLAGYELQRTSTWGEASFRIMLGQVVGSDTAAVAADGWGGDSYRQWFDGTNAAFLIVYEGDTDADVEELRAALLDFARTSVPDEDFVWVDIENGLLYFIAADETSIGEQIRDTIGLT